MQIAKSRLGAIKFPEKRQPRAREQTYLATTKWRREQRRWVDEQQQVTVVLRERQRLHFILTAIGSVRDILLVRKQWSWILMKSYFSSKTRGSPMWSTEPEGDHYPVPWKQMAARWVRAPSDREEESWSDLRDHAWDGMYRTCQWPNHGEHEKESMTSASGLNKKVDSGSIYSEIKKKD